MKKLVLAVAFLLPTSWAYAEELSMREFFRETENQAIDFAIGSAVEAGYARDLINGGNYGVVQTPIVYVTPYVTADFGYVSGFEDSVRGALMVGGSMRINRIIEDAFPDRVWAIRNALPVVGKYWDDLWFGPWIAKRFSDFDHTLLAGIKAGLRF